MTGPGAPGMALDQPARPAGGRAARAYAVNNPDQRRAARWFMTTGDITETPTIMVGTGPMWNRG